MKASKFVRGIGFAVKTLLAEKNVLMTVDEAKDYLNSINPDENSSCWVENNERIVGGYELSVILPAYNSEKWIEKAIESILSQETEYPFEVIAIDDGSNDSTGDILEHYSKFDNINIIHQDNKGFSGARNTGIDKATGNYLMFVDSDDELLPGAIQALMKCAKDNHADVVCGNYVRTYENGKIISKRSFSYEKINPIGRLYGQPWGKIYSRNLFRNLRFPDGYWYEDSIFSMIVWPQCNVCYTIPEYVYGYFYNEKGISFQSRKSVKCIDSLYVTASLLNDRKEHFDLDVRDDDYDVFLRNVKLTHRRTSDLGVKIQEAIFVIQCNLTEVYFSDCKASELNLGLSNSLRDRNYKSFLLECFKNYMFS